MKQTPYLQQAQEAMRRGRLTEDGFLGDDTRLLADILAADDAAVRRMGVAHAEIADEMARLREAGRAGLGEFVFVPPHFEVRVDEVRGLLACPFGEAGLLPKTHITIRNIERKMELTISDLNIHLIREHGFYEGLGSPFRVDPQVAVRVLDLDRKSRRTGGA